MDLLITTPTLTLFDYSQIHIEVSSRCTLKCPRCPRTELNPTNINQDILLGEFASAFSPAILQQIKKIVFCGDIGDPIYARDFLKICQYIKQSSDTSLVIVTNGSYQKESWWQSLAGLLTDRDQVTFSVDGWDQTSNDLYRVNSDFDSIQRGMTTLRAYSNCLMVWSAIYFKFNEDHMSKISSIAQELGFDSFQAVKSSKFDGRYSVEGVDPLKPVNVAATAQYEKSINNFTGRTMPIYVTRQSNHPWARCLNRDKDLFINVSGLVFPCPWFNSGYQENKFIQAHSYKLSIKYRSLIEILNDPIWQEFTQLLDCDPLEVCQIKCKNARS